MQLHLIPKSYETGGRAYEPAGRIKAIRAILGQSLTCGRVGRTDYHLSQEQGIYTCTMISMERRESTGQMETKKHTRQFTISY